MTGNDVSRKMKVEKAGSNTLRKEEMKMKSFDYVIQDELGLHARPAGLLVKEAKQFASRISLTKDGKTVSATQLMMLMGMGVKRGATVTVTVEGEDEDAACAAIEKFFRENL